MQEIIMKIKDLRTYFYTKKGKVKAIDGVDFSIESGKIIGIVGESGSGKSMTAMTIMGLLKDKAKVMSGSIEFLGKDLLKLSSKELASIRGSEIGMIFQEPMTSLNPLMTVGKQISEVLIRHKKVSKEEAREKTLMMLEKVGINNPIRRYNSYPHQLSGGLRQRVMIAMALICEPKILIADEPTTALDVTVQAQILKLMKKLCKEMKTSIIFISHNLGVIASICDYVYVMYAGKVMEEGDVISLFENTKHPYTRGLLKSIPRIDEKQDKLPIIEGVIPNLIDIKSSCVFYNRCKYKKDECMSETLCMNEISNTHKTSCLLYKK